MASVSASAVLPVPKMVKLSKSSLRWQTSEAKNDQVPSSSYYHNDTLTVGALSDGVLDAIATRVSLGKVGVSDVGAVLTDSGAWIGDEKNAANTKPKINGCY